MAKSNTDKIKKDIETLQDDLNKLAGDMTKAWDNLVEMGKTEAGHKKELIEEELKSRFQNLKDEMAKLREKGSGILDNPSKTIKNAGKKIEDNPLMSMLLALGVGIFIGKVIEKISKSE